MEQEVNVSFKQMPTGLDNFHVGVKDIAVYLTMRQFENWKTHGTYVTIDKLSQVSGLSKGTIRKCIKNLILDEYLILIKRPGLSNEYKFNKTLNFEGFSDEFINNPGLTPGLKGYLAIIQPYMNTSDGQYGVIGMRDLDLAKRTHLSRKTIYTYNRQLQELGFMVNGKSHLPDIIENSGCKGNVKIYDPKSYGQAIIFALRNHEERLNDIQDEQQIQRKTIEDLTAEIRDLKRRQAVSDLKNQKLHEQNAELLKTNKKLYDALNIDLYRKQNNIDL